MAQMTVVFMDMTDRFTSLVEHTAQQGSKTSLSRQLLSWDCGRFQICKTLNL